MWLSLNVPTSDNHTERETGDRAHLHFDAISHRPFSRGTALLLLPLVLVLLLCLRFGSISNHHRFSAVDAITTGGKIFQRDRVRSFAQPNNEKKQTNKTKRNPLYTNAPEHIFAQALSVRVRYTCMAKRREGGGWLLYQAFASIGFLVEL